MIGGQRSASERCKSGQQIGEAHPLRREPVEMWSGNLGRRIVGANVPVPHVIGQDQHDVGWRCRLAPNGVQ